MKRILSAEVGGMAKISKAAVKKMINGRVVVSDSAASLLARMLERKASRIARYAVKRARSKKRTTVLAEDIESYRVRFGD